MGGSLGLAIRAADPAAIVTGYDADPAVARRALDRGAVMERFDDPAAIPRDAEAVVLAVPPAPRRRSRARSPRPSPRTRSSWTSRASCSPRWPRCSRPPPWVTDGSAHPLAGSESSGIESARPDLYRGAAVLIGLPIEAGTAAGRAAALWTSIGARPGSIAPSLHDALVALTSHLPYAASVALVRTLRRTGSMTRALAETAGPGLRDTTRVAGSPPELWAEILELNGPKLLPALELLEREVRLRRAIEDEGTRIARPPGRSAGLPRGAGPATGTMSRAATRPGRPLRGGTEVPGDKSITQRAILLGALSPGETRIRGANPGEDARAALGLVRALGARVRASRGEWTIQGAPCARARRSSTRRTRGPRSGWRRDFSRRSASSRC